MEDMIHESKNQMKKKKKKKGLNLMEISLTVPYFHDLTLLCCQPAYFPLFFFSPFFYGIFT
jgi:hypothetical protein